MIPMYAPNDAFSRFRSHRSNAKRGAPAARAAVMSFFGAATFASAPAAYSPSHTSRAMTRRPARTPIAVDHPEALAHVSGKAVPKISSPPTQTLFQGRNRSISISKPATNAPLDPMESAPQLNPGCLCSIPAPFFWSPQHSTEPRPGGFKPSDHRESRTDPRREPAPTHRPGTV